MPRRLPQYRYSRSKLQASRNRDRGIFCHGVQARLDAAGIAWSLAVEGDNTRAVEASVSGDLAVHIVLEGSEPRHVGRIKHGGTLPDLGRMKINLYTKSGPEAAVAAMAELIRRVMPVGRVSRA